MAESAGGIMSRLSGTVQGLFTAESPRGIDRRQRHWLLNSSVRVPHQIGE